LQIIVNFIFLFSCLFHTGVNSVVSIIETNFIENKAGEGGAIYISNQNVTITYSHFENNTALDQGGAIASLTESNLIP